MMQSVYGQRSHTFPSTCAYCEAQFIYGDVVYYSNNVPELTGLAFCSGECAKLYYDRKREQAEQEFQSVAEKMAGVTKLNKPVGH